MKQQKTLILWFLLVLSGCASAPQTTRLPQAEPPPLEAGWGRMFVTAGISGGVRLWSKHQVGPFLINDKEVGSTAKGEYLLVDLRPGTYKATCTQHEPFNTTNLPIELQINAGEQRYFACDMAFADEADSIPELLILGGLSGFVTIASGEISFLTERPIDLYDSVRSSYTKFTGVSDSPQNISTSSQIQRISNSKTKVTTPSSEGEVSVFDFYGRAEEEINTQTYDKNLWDKALVETGGDQNKTKARYIELRANQLYIENGGSMSATSLSEQSIPKAGESNIEISGTYISDISSTSRFFEKDKHQTMQIVFVQIGNRIVGTNSSTKLNIIGTRSEDNIAFYIPPPNKVSRFQEITGRWKVNADGTKLEGNWKIQQKGFSGKWNLTKIE